MLQCARCAVALPPEAEWLSTTQLLDLLSNSTDCDFTCLEYKPDLAFVMYTWPYNPMRSRRQRVLVFFLFTMIVILVGCGPRPGAAERVASDPTSPADSALVVDLPALYIDYAADGVAYVGNTRLAELGVAVGRDLALLDLDAAWIARLTAANIQHVQLLNRPAGVVVLVNGVAVPSVGWNEEMLVNTALLFQALEDDASWLEALLPVAAEWGVGVVVRFPLASDAVPIPLAAASPDAEGVVAVAAAPAAAAQEAYLALIGEPPQLLIEVTYTVDGAWTVADMNATAWSQVIDAPWTRLNLPPALVQKISVAGIKMVTITSNRQGLFVTVNEQALPYLRWANGEVNQLVDLVQKLDLLGAGTQENPATAVLIETVQNLLPFLQTLEVKLIVHFP